MKYLLSLCILCAVFASCGAKKTTTSKPRVVIGSTSTGSESKASNVVSNALKYQGVRYKFGGTTTSGMDCSGLIYTAFKEENVTLPRVSRDMAKRGKRIATNKAKEGDLVFFKTNKNRNVINHVGLIVTAKNGIEFIHSSSSKGVIISSLNENYWKSAFVEVRRIL